MADPEIPVGAQLAALTVQTASAADAMAFAASVVMPTFAKGVIIRREAVLAWLERLSLEERALDCMQRLSQRYGSDLLRIALPGRSQIVVLTATAALAILDATPEPFSPATLEKRSALGHFEPNTSLVSRGPSRLQRRAVSDRALESASDIHSLAPEMSRIVGEEIGCLLATCRGRELAWTAFRDAWSRIVRRIVLGNGAAEDRSFTELLDGLRRRANWAFLRRRDEAKRRELGRRLEQHLAREEPGSLAGVLARLPAGPDAAIPDQVMQWLFAFDAAAIVIFRTLALLLSDQELGDVARQKLEPGSPSPLLRHCILETLRLWPTTPAVLRETTREVPVSGTALAAHSSIIIYAPYLHRDARRIADPHRFLPDRWNSPNAHREFIPFSAGPAECPAHHLVPMLGSFALGELLGPSTLQLKSPGPNLARLPATFDHAKLRFLVPG